MTQIVEVAIESEAAQTAIAEAEVELDRRYGPSTDSSVSDASAFRPPNGSFFVALDDDSGIIGGVGLRSIADGVGEIKRLWVAEAARRMGVGAALMHAAESAAQRFGFSLLELETGPKQPEAVALYQAAGWELVAELPIKVSDYPHAVRFIKRYESDNN